MDRQLIMKVLMKHLAAHHMNGFLQVIADDILATQQPIELKQLLRQQREICAEAYATFKPKEGNYETVNEFTAILNAPEPHQTKG